MRIPQRQSPLAQRLGGVGFVGIKIKKNIDAAEYQIGEQYFPEENQRQGSEDNHSCSGTELVLSHAAIISEA
jgi:hypothetical protein